MRLPSVILACALAAPALPHGVLAKDAPAIARDEIPPVNAQWAADVRARAHAIASLGDEDFSDLRFLKPLLEGKRVVMLGESGHGVSQFSAMKVRLIKFLHREMGFDVVAFESSMSGCDVADHQIGAEAPLHVMRDCAFGVWHSAETLSLFEYLESEREAGRRIALAGVDVQNSSATGQRVVAARFKAMLDAVDPERSARLEADERMLVERYTRGLSAEEGGAIAARYEALAEVLARDKAALAPHWSSRIEDIDLAIQEARSRAVFARQQASRQRPVESNNLRDRGMADNLEFLLDKLYPGRKIVVWAHNFHVARRGYAGPDAAGMGEWIAKRRGAEVYAVGMFMGRGIAAWNDRQRYEIQPPAADTLEAVLANAGSKMSFVDLSRATPAAGAEWMFEAIAARDWGTRKITLVPARTYDGLLYIDAVTPPDYR